MPSSITSPMPTWWSTPPLSMIIGVLSHFTPRFSAST